MAVPEVRGSGIGSGAAVRVPPKGAVQRRPEQVQGRPAGAAGTAGSTCVLLGCVEAGAGSLGGGVGTRGGSEAAGAAAFWLRSVRLSMLPPSGSGACGISLLSAASVCSVLHRLAGVGATRAAAGSVPPVLLGCSSAHTGSTRGWRGSRTAKHLAAVGSFV